MPLKKFQNLEKFFEKVRLGNERDFQDALFKKEGYCVRWFKEPLEEWVEERTPLGRLVLYYHEYLVHPSKALLKDATRTEQIKFEKRTKIDSCQIDDKLFILYREIPSLFQN